MEASWEDVFGCIVSAPNATRDAIIARSGRPPHEVDEALLALVDLGVVHPSQVVTAGWRAVSPTLAIGRSLGEQERAVARDLQRIADTRQVLANLGEVYRGADIDQESIIRLVDRDGVLARISDLVSSVTFEVAAFVTNKPSAAAIAQSRELDDHLLSQGVRLRSLCLDGFRRDRRMLKALEDSVAAGAEIRTVPSLPTRMILFDRTQAVIASHPTDPERGALLVSNHSAVTLFADLFEHMWRTADPFPEGVPGSPGAVDLTVMERQVILMLAQGNKDESIARSTGQSVRTVRRIIATLTDRVGANGRFDLALHAAERGWASVNRGQ